MTTDDRDAHPLGMPVHGFDVIRVDAATFRRKVIEKWKGPFPPDYGELGWKFPTQVETRDKTTRKVQAKDPGSGAIRTEERLFDVSRFAILREDLEPDLMWYRFDSSQCRHAFKLALYFQALLGTEGWGWRAWRTIERAMGRKRPDLMKDAAVLEQLGFLHVHHGSGRHANRYYLTIPAPADAGQTP